MSFERLCHAVARTPDHERTLFSAKMRVGLTSAKAQNVSFCGKLKESLASAETVGVVGVVVRSCPCPCAAAGLPVELSRLLAAKLR
jgi:hypothetical protein